MSQDKEMSILAALKDLGAWCKSPGDYERSGCHASFFIDAGALKDAAVKLLERGWFLEDISGVDVEEGVMLAYHFDRYDRAERVVLRLVAARPGLSAPSIAGVYQGADWHERECFDFFGVIFQGHPGLKPLLLPDDLGMHPLVKQQGRKSLHGLLPQDQLVDVEP